MILDILTVLFFVSGFILILMMFLERQRDVLHGHYVTRTTMARRPPQDSRKTSSAAHRAQADALEIEAQAKRRLADEYDAAQERGEIKTQRDNQAFSKTEKASGPEIIPPKELHEARIIPDAGVIQLLVELGLKAKGKA